MKKLALRRVLISVRNRFAIGRGRAGRRPSIIRAEALQGLEAPVGREVIVIDRLAAGPSS